MLDQKTPQFPDLALSLCREIPGTDLTPDKFQSREISYSDFVEKIRSNPNFLAEKEVVIRLNEKYLPWDVAAPILLRKICQNMAKFNLTLKRGFSDLETLI